MTLAITKGKIQRPVRALVYGPEGVGKTTFAAAWPNPIFIDIEDGSSNLDVARIARPSSWAMLKGTIEELTKDAQGFKTIVFDTADWLERLIVAHVCAEGKCSSIEAYGGGYGKGYTRLAEEWKPFLDSLGNLQARTGMHVLFLAHSQIKHTEIPEENGTFDRYAVRMNEKSSAPLREWVDLMLFANFETLVVAKDDKNAKDAKGQGGNRRIMRTTHHACWDAKNRFNLADTLAFEFKQLAHIFADAPAVKPEQAPQPPPPVSPPPPATVQPEPLPTCLPQALRDLMIFNGVSVDELKSVCTKTYPIDTPIENYEESFWTGKIIPQWTSGVYPMILKFRNKAKAA